MRNAFIRVVNQADGTELARYDLTEDASTETAMVFGELYRNGAEWKFRAVGQGYASGPRGHRPGLRRQRLTRSTDVCTDTCDGPPALPTKGSHRWAAPHSREGPLCI